MPAPLQTASGHSRSLASAKRLRLLHALVKRPSLSITVLAETFGRKPHTASSQLPKLVDKGILSNVRNGTTGLDSRQAGGQLPGRPRHELLRVKAALT